jgi:uncharacterized membrane protein YgaE (UPF0421/DUF939 family)
LTYRTRSKTMSGLFSDVERMLRITSQEIEQFKSIDEPEDETTKEMQDFKEHCVELSEALEQLKREGRTFQVNQEQRDELLKSINAIQKNWTVVNMAGLQANQSELFRKALLGFQNALTIDTKKGRKVEKVDMGGTGMK